MPTVDDDLVTRLREKYSGQLPICAEAADEIEALRADIARILNSLCRFFDETADRD